VIANSGGVRAVLAAAMLVASDAAFADDSALRLRATVAGSVAAPLTIEILRWSSDAERTPLLAALAAPAPAPTAQAPPGGRAAAAGRAGGRGGRGGRGAAAPPASQAVRLSTAVKAAPTVGFIWGDGPTGYSIKYAWRSSAADGDRVVLVTDRRMGAHSPAWPQLTEAALKAGAIDEVAYTVIEMRVDGQGVGEGKSSLAAAVVVDADAKTLALDGYAAAPVLLKVTR
jgi:hypothetical protein